MKALKDKLFKYIIGERLTKGVHKDMITNYLLMTVSARRRLYIKRTVLNICCVGMARFVFYHSVDYEKGPAYIWISLIHHPTTRASAVEDNYTPMACIFTF